jgi:lysosomal Pro-X carboxypeptidase
MTLGSCSLQSREKMAPRAASLHAVVPALLLVLLLLAASAPAAVGASSKRRRTPSPFPAGLAPPRYPVAPAADGSGNATAAKPFTAHYFPQELDHFTFTPNSSRVFSQKYLLNDTFWRKPSAGAAAAGPLFVYTGNEGDIEWFATNTGFMFDIAPRFGALLVFIEVHAPPWQIF